MSLWFKSPMPKKVQVFFFIYVLLIMATFALVGITFSQFHYGLAGLLLLAAVLMAGIGFMVRKRVLRSMGVFDQIEEA
ncbi:hypothetical protein CIG75_05025 [Tumebacillus algifaecis]|uniref:Uncharacterized protein n=1 Tax=Tumebacillus algifaecis TaxID=1214604 RepID=A0A223CYD7_9BACL|nr:hypothetical protein [Tumebacillus algifaecis]ASS74410.1 hypothetical protein CIG75_05025 [Tumebacillus algifaecis]